MKSIGRPVQSFSGLRGIGEDRAGSPAGLAYTTHHHENKKTLAIAGGIAIGVGDYFTIKQATSHLINNGDSNYLGEKPVQDALYKVADSK